MEQNNLTVSIICPVHNGEKYIKKLFEKIRAQSGIKKIEIITPISSSDDNSYEECNKYSDIVYKVVDFNHGKTRHEAAKKANNNILVFITQDIMPIDDRWLIELINPLDCNIIATFSRQIAYKQHSEIEKLIRTYNYPNKDRICNKKNEKTNGRYNIFFSDASSAIVKSEFFKLGGYDYNVPTCEDTLLASKIINSGKSFMYVSKSIIYHSHKLSLIGTYNRYKKIGEFEKKFKKEIDFGNTEGEGVRVVLYLLKNLMKNGKIVLIFYTLMDFVARWIGYKVGKKL